MTRTELSDTTDDAALNAGSTVISVDKARALVDLFAAVTTSRDVDTFAEGFTEDCVVRFNCTELRGREALRAFMAARFGRFDESYKCEKTLRAVSGNVLGVTWLSTWRDPATKAPMRGRGSEFWVMHGERIARWDATFGM